MTELIAQSNRGGSPLGLLLPLVLMGVLFYFLLIRPQQRRQRAQRNLLNAVDVGDEVMTAGGILGTVTDIDDDEGIVTVEVAPGTRVRMVKRAISERVTQDEGADGSYDDDDEPEADVDQSR